MKKLINKLKIPLLAGAFVLFSASDPNKNKAEDIKVNRGSGKKYHLSRAEAEKRLHELAKTAYEEDAWIYYKGVLTDVGFNSKKDQVEVDLGAILSINFNSKDTLYLYHIHPFKAWGEEVEPSSGRDFLYDELLKRFIDLKDEQIILKVLDDSGEWIYNSNKALKRIAPYSDSNRISKIIRLIHYAHKEAFPGKERKKEDIEFFIERIEDYGLKVGYKKLE